MMFKRRFIHVGIAIGLVWGVLALDASIADAHGVSVFAWVDGDTIHVESKFSGGRRPKDAPIEVLDGNGNLLLTGRTNDQGEFSFKVPQKTEMKIVLEAGMGHKAEWTIPLSELQDAPAAPPPAPAEAKMSETEPSATPAEKAASADTSPPAAAASGLSAADLQAAIEAALDKKLKPVMKMLAESRQTGASLEDIIGGLGYILGLVGLATFIQYRRKK
jgi:nickel transport protein